MSPRTAALLALLVLGCRDKDTAVADVPEVGEGVFSEGCPDGGALARRIGVEASLPGKVAVGTAGDYLLANEQAAFVITEPDKGSTYYHYGGIVADAVGMDGCEVVSEDRLDEVALVLGELDLLDISASIIRGFRGNHAEVIADGSDGGPATVRVTGTDDTYWLVEYELILRGIDGGGRPVSGPLGVELAVDYTLYPGSPVLWIDVTVENTGSEDLTLFTAALISYGETMDVYSYASGSLGVGGLDLDYGIPWMLATDGSGSLAYAVEDGNLAYIGISGVQVAVDLLQATSDPIDISPGQSDTVTSMLSVGTSDGPSATRPLALTNPEPIPDQPYTLSSVTGVAVDAAGAPVPGAHITIEADSGDTGWGTLDIGVADADGAFSVPVLVFSEPWRWRLIASADGRDDSAPVEVSPGDTDVSLALSEAGTLDYTLTDASGDDAPARLYLQRSDGVVTDLWLAGTGTAPLPPGSYDFTATRGYEYAPVTGTVTVPAGGSGALFAELERVVDTAGYLSVDTHVHTSHSPDSRTGQVQALQVAAAHGLDVVVNTEHEAIVDQSLIPVEAGVSAWTTNVSGEEVTAVVPEHMTMFPAESDGSVRGGIVEWYGLDIAELFSAMRDRSGGGVNLLNHPGYLDTIEWDRLTAEPGMDDPTLIGLLPDAALWSWDFDGIEVYNSHGSPFDDGNRRFGNWMSMLNAGHPVVAVGCSDDHGGGGIGFPRTYFAAASSSAVDFDEQELVDAFLTGDAVASAGAFVRASVDGAGPGALVTDTDGTVDLSVHVEAMAEADVTHLLVLSNCSELLSIPADDPDGIIKHSEVLSLSVAEDAHLVVLAMGSGALPAGLPQYDAARLPRATTSPIYIDADGDGVWTPPGGQECTFDLDPPQ